MRPAWASPPPFATQALATSSTDEPDHIAMQQRPRGRQTRDDAQWHRERDRLDGNRDGDLHESQRRVVSPLEKPIDGALSKRRDDDAEDRPAHRYQQSFNEHLHENRSRRDPHE